MNKELSEEVEQASVTFRDAFKEFEIIAAGAERHGVWEWRAMMQNPPLRRYIVLAVFNLERADIYRDAEVHVGIDNELWYGKRVVLRSLVTPNGLPDFLLSNSEVIVDAARELTEDDATIPYGQRRALPPDVASSPT